MLAVPSPVIASALLLAVTPSIMDVPESTGPRPDRHAALRPPGLRSPWLFLVTALPLALSCRAENSPPTVAVQDPAGAAVETADLTSIERVSVWLRSCAVDSDQGRAWPSSPGQSEAVSTNLYDGTPGVVLFFLQRHRATDGADPRDLADAIAGADYLLSTLPEAPAPAGFYVGVAGIGFVLDEVYLATEEARFANGVERCVDLIAESALTTDSGITWNRVTDVISGSAGTGLWLLQRARRADDRRALELAVQAGRELLARGQPTEHGTQWPMSAGNPRLMPNFSHGTAGVAYFLLELHRATLNTEWADEGAFLAAAIDGASALRAIATKDGLVPHHTPGGEDLFYLGWCHGPTGTARLFWQLAEQTSDAAYRSDVAAMAQSLRDADLPKGRTPGYWNNVGICCGSAGVAAFLDDLGRSDGDRRDAELIRRLTDDILARGTDGADGLHWVHAEHRTRPDLLIAQTGLMQGAAGIGLWLLQAANPGKADARLDWPDSPW